MKLVNEIKAFRASKMNLDVAPVMAEPMDTGEVLNMIEEAQSGRLTNLKGVESVSSMAINSAFGWPAGTNACVGSCYDVESSELLFAIANARGTHSILSMNIDTYELVWVLQDELLNFKTDYPVSMDVVSGLLYFTDGYFNSFLNNDFNPPRKINIAKAKKYTEKYPDRWTFSSVLDGMAHTNNPAHEGYTAFLSNTAPDGFDDGDNVVTFSRSGINRVKEVTGYAEIIDSGYRNGMFFVITSRPWQYGDDDVALSGYMLRYETGMYFGIDWQVLDRIKYPPAYAPTAEYDTDALTPSNNLKGELFQFCYRWIYDDNEKSVFSPKSNIPLPTEIGLLNGSYFFDDTVDNRIVIWLDSGDINVRTIELLSRKSNIGSWRIINRIEKYDEGGSVLVDNDIYIRYDFYNTEYGEAIDQLEVGRPYDAVPQVSLRQCIIEKNRILDANYTEYYDNVNIDTSLSSVQNEVEVNKIDGELTANSRKVVTATSSPFNQFTCAEVNLIDFWEPGYTYIFDVESYPHKYDDPNGAIQSGTVYDVYDEFAYKIINSQAVVDCPEGTTFEDFINSVASNLRNGNSFDSAVIALNAYGYKGFHSYNSFAYPDQTSGTFVQFPAQKSIGFIIQTFDGDFGPCVYCADFSVKILKLSKRNVFTTFKSGAKHPFGLFYLDRASRFNSVNRSESSEIFIPYQNIEGLTHSLYQNKINWKINNIPPDWAEYYAWGYAKNTSIDYSLYATMSSIEYIDASNSVFLCVNQYIVDQNELTKKFNVPIYTWESGDRIRFIANKGVDNYFKTIPTILDFEIDGVLYPGDDGSGSTYLKNDLGESVKDAGGNRIKDPKQTGIIISYFNFTQHGIKVNDTIVEIYRPKKTTENSVYYEFQNILPILDPHTSNRRHGSGYLGSDQVVVNGISIVPASGEFKYGDAYIRSRLMENFFPCESFSFSDYFNSNSISIGTINAVNPNARRINYASKLIYSGRLIQDTLVNDLSRVDSSDSFELPNKYGAINAIAEVGDILKVIQQSKTSSIIIGRAGVTQPNEEGSQIISSTKDVLGTLMRSKGSAGTVHPMSVTKSDTKLYWFDFHAGAIFRDSGNGAQNLSDDYNLKSFMATACDTWRSPDNVTVVSAWDERSGVAWFTFIGTGLSFTVGFREARGKNSDGFVLFASFIPEFYGIAKNTLTSFRGGDLWLHGSDNVPRCNFYGVQYGYHVDVLLNQFPANIKRFKQLKVATNLPVECSEITIEPNGNYPLGMSSILKAAAFTSVQGKRVASFGRNMLTTGVTPSYDDLINGDELEGTAMTVKVRGGSTDEHWITTIEAEEIVYE